MTVEQFRDLKRRQAEAFALFFETCAKAGYDSTVVFPPQQKKSSRPPLFLVAKSTI